MKLMASEKAASLGEDRSLPAKQYLRPKLLFSWEMYLIILVAGFLRLYRIDTTEFNLDQANLFRMAYDAVHHGMLVATSNGSSLGTINPPAIIYFLMPTALFSTNPLWAAVWFALLMTAGVLITYIFVRRYFGRVTGTIAGLLFAAANAPVYYSRFIWNQNLLLLFTPLFIAVLLWGVVERRKGWFAPAVLLLGLNYQFHGSSALLVSALLIAVALVPRAISWRDVGFAVLSLLVLFFPYLLWLFYSHFRDIAIMINASRLPAQIDTQALSFDQMLLGVSLPANAPFLPNSPFPPLVNLMNAVMTVLLIMAGGMAVVQVIWPGRCGRSTIEPERGSPRWWERVWKWWLELRTDAYRSSLLLLLVWQVVPLLALSRHSIPLYPHYLLFLMPGQYILIALLLTRAIEWFRSRPFGQLGLSASIGTGFLSIALIATQYGASLWFITLITTGNFSGGGHQWNNFYTLNSIKNAIHEADQLAQQRHLDHLYIEMYANYDYLASATYLAEHTQTPATVFGEKCLVLPAATSGPAVLLVGPYNDVTDGILPHFASATLVDKPVFLGEEPFKLYIVQTLPTLAPARSQNTTLPNGMQLLDTQRVNILHSPWLATRWNILRTDPIQSQTTYAYKLINMAVPPASTPDDQIRECFYTSIQTGDQFISTFPLSSRSQAPTSLKIQVQSYKVTPTEMQYTLFNRFKITFATGFMDFQIPVALLTSTGQDYVTIPIPK
jgi:4-amino-4-deoxy-L-arabinose transferase-like glycosyltransferase